MKIKTVTTVNGVNPIYFGDYAPRFYWFRNLGDTTLYVSAKPNPIAGGDDVSELLPNSSTSIETDEGEVYILGAGKVEIHNTDSKFCPFRSIHVSGGGNKIITPESLGYADVAAMFFDGIYNFPNKHVDNNYGWVDIANDNIMIRNNLSGSVYDDHYDKLSGTDSILIAPAITYDNFTVEIVFDIISVPTDECDMASNFNTSGFGIYTYNNILKAVIHNGSAYVGATLSSFNIGTKYVAQLVYDGNVFRVYINGVDIGAVEVSLENYNKSTEPFMLGGLRTGSYSDGAYNFYRFTAYDKVLTEAQLTQNYNTDATRFNL